MNTGERLITIKEVAKQLSMSVRTMERRIKKGLMPQPEYNGPRRVYRESIIPILVEQATRGES